MKYTLQNRIICYYINIIKSGLIMSEFKLFLTQNAKKYFSQKLNENNSVYIDLKQSGCTGYAYQFKIAKKNTDSQLIDDLYFNISETIKPFIQDSVIDYKKDGLNNKLVFDNPNVSNVCGCGESVSFKKVKL